ncbi:hypothetical protein NQ317_005075 [Molorchus minor]|uniref:Uncharacterized protein n=1 Tax=Molorchus minor TaxID=1323400 RepID=A0ABQ9JX36_9CUCU|nr:hypothetical protein NQ317_005075 [Molorchus minor]
MAQTGNIQSAGNKISFSKLRSKIYNKENREVDTINVLAIVEAAPKTPCKKYNNLLSAARYLQILENILLDLLDEVLLGHLPEQYFQKDGAPAYNSQIVDIAFISEIQECAEKSCRLYRPDLVATVSVEPKEVVRVGQKIARAHSVPLIGASHNFIGDAYEITCKFMAVFKQYPGIFKIWHGLRLFYGVSDPNYFEILLPRCLDKEEWYLISYPALGHGLLTAPVYKWKRQRKMIMPTFNQKILDESAMGVKVQAQTTDAPYSKWVERFFEGVFLKIFVFWYHFDFIFDRTKMAKEFYQAMDNIHNYGKNVS